jgi:hypothetical protein
MPNVLAFALHLGALKMFEPPFGSLACPPVGPSILIVPKQQPPSNAIDSGETRPLRLHDTVVIMIYPLDLFFCRCPDMMFRSDRVSILSSTRGDLIEIRGVATREPHTTVPATQLTYHLLGRCPKVPFLNRSGRFRESKKK